MLYLVFFIVFLCTLLTSFCLVVLPSYFLGTIHFEKKAFFPQKFNNPKTIFGLMAFGFSFF